MGYNNLANFHIIKKIGRGQFSEVYRAAYILDHTPVALKKVQVRNFFICEISIFYSISAIIFLVYVISVKSGVNILLLEIK